MLGEEDLAQSEVAVAFGHPELPGGCPLALALRPHVRPSHTPQVTFNKCMSLQHSRSRSLRSRLLSPGPPLETIRTSRLQAISPSALVPIFCHRS